MSTTVSYEDSGKTLVLDVTSDFVAGDQITIAGLSFTNFTAASSAIVWNWRCSTMVKLAAEDDKWKAIGGERLGRQHAGLR